jgi:hypothetical protein
VGIPKNYTFEYPSMAQLVIPAKQIEHAIILIRGHKVLLDRDLAGLYGVKPIALRQQVKRNPDRFPEDFMFQLSEDEAKILVSQNVIPSMKYFGGFLPYAFTREGVAMLSSVLRSVQVVRVNVESMRAFVRLRQIISSNEELARKLMALERKYDKQFQVVFEAIHKLMIPPEIKRRPIGFQAQEVLRKKLTKAGIIGVLVLD